MAFGHIPIDTMANSHNNAAMDIANIITALGGRAPVASETGTESNTVVYWERRGRIPPRHWSAIIKMAANAGREDISLETLSEIWSAPRPTTSRAQAPSQAPAP
jgi:hypothetical protein